MGRIHSRRLLVALLSLTVLTGIGACSSGPEPPLADPEPEEGTEPVGRDLFFDPSTYVGTRVTATGYVSEVIGPTAFRIAGDRFEGPGILVVGDEPIPVIDDGDLVQIVGTVRWFETEAFARDQGVRLDPATFHQFEGSIALAAERITVGGIRR